MSKPCSHQDGKHNAETDAECGMHFVDDCFDFMPVFALDSRELKALYRPADVERCCDMLDIV